MLLERGKIWEQLPLDTMSGIAFFIASLLDLLSRLERLLAMLIGT